jgi:hypothetical protein
MQALSSIFGIAPWPERLPMRAENLARQAPR